jgi:Glycosyl hydrolase-like 10
MFTCKVIVRPMFSWRFLLAAIFSSSLISPFLWSQSSQAQVTAYCRLSATVAQEKEALLVSSLKGDQDSARRYEDLVRQHSTQIQECRSQTWPKTQAIWLRLYPCDMQPGALERIMDRIVNRGYNQVYVDSFYDGQVLLPQASNPTIWPSILRAPGAENVDLLAQAIAKGRQRGLKVYSWMFTMNFGYTYAQRPDRESAIARNGKGQTSLYVVDNGSQVFIDPYNPQAQRDYSLLIQEIVRRRPDGVLFDYIRYPRQAGTDSISSRVTDLWLYTDATQQALFRRALNYKGLDLIRRFLGKGYVTGGDIESVDKLYPQEGEPMWQGRNQPPLSPFPLTAEQRQPLLQSDLWQLSVAHAMQGVLDFVNLASTPVTQQGIPAGVVFFPEGNQSVGRGYDSRLQPWDRFPASLEWHTMAYASCGNTSCIAEQVRRVLSLAKPGTQVIPALAGTWGGGDTGRPSLESQMQALHQFAPQIQAVSHFSYSWQFPQHDGDRKFCRAQ